MRGSEFLDKMEFTDPAYVEAADAMPKKKKNGMIKWGAIAACLAIMVFAGTMLLRPDDSGPADGLPVLTISDSAYAMGFEGYMAYDISELVNSNPWNKDMELSTLPVYQNTLTYDSSLIAAGTDFEKMREVILDAAAGLGLDTTALTVTDNAPDEETIRKMTEKFEAIGESVPDSFFAPTELIINADGLRIEVSDALTATVTFDPAVSLPDGYNFTHYAPYGDTASAAEYFKTEYGGLIGAENPQLNIRGGDYNIYNQQSYRIEFFDSGENDTESIINYNFYRTSFACDDDGKLFIARKYQPDLSLKTGDYPIVDADMARDLLVSGKYITSVPYDPPGEEYIAKVELVYRTDKYDAYYMPYYRFLVELPEEERENGLKTFGAYYVPAVESTYISNMPRWNGHFN